MGTEKTVEEGKNRKFPLRELCFLLSGLIIGIAISFGIFTSAVKDAANDIIIENTTSEDETTVEEEESTSNKSEENSEK